MRHLRSILYALVLAPAVWILSGVGFTHDLTGRARDNGGVESLSGLLLLVLAGAAYAIVLFAPISPAGPALFGLVFFGISGWALVAPSAYADAWPAGVTEEGFDLSRPGYGLAAMLAVPLICTALSSRRWERYEPPVIPLLGTLGRARGRAAVAGTPIASVTTEILETTGSPAMAGRSSRGSSRGSSPDPETEALVTMLMALGSGEETAILPTPAATAGKTVAAEPNASASVAADADDADDAEADAPTVDVAAKPATADSSADAAQAITAPGKATTAETGDEPTTAKIDKRIAPATPEVAPPAGSDATTKDVVQPVAAGDPKAATTEVVAPVSSGQVTDAVESPLPGDEQTEPVEVATPAPDEPAEAVTETVAFDEPEDEKTQVIKLPAGERTTRDLTRQPGEGPTHSIDDGGRTMVIGPDQRTQVIHREAAEETQVIDLARLRTREIDGAKTQVISTVEPPGDHTQVLSIPTPGETGKAAREPGPDQQPQPQPQPSSIIGAERPDPAADPTTRIEPDHRPGDRNPGDKTTVDVGSGKRVMTVTNQERPADEASDDTRRTVRPPVPTQRRRRDES